MARPGRWPLIGGVGVTLIGIAPLAVTMLAAAIAGAHGCRLDEGDAHPCLIGGHDWGDTLYAMGLAFWLELLTIWLVPIGLVLVGIGLFLRLRRPRGG